MGEVLNRGVK